MTALSHRIAPLLPLILCLACATESGETGLNGSPNTSSGGGSSGGGNSGGGSSGGGNSSGGSSSLPTGGGGSGGACAAMCEQKVTKMVPVENPATCSAPAYVPGKEYPAGGMTVSLDGNEYTTKWWTNKSPAGSTGEGDWSAPTACPGGGTTMKEVTTTEQVCCAASGGGGSTSGSGGSASGGGGGASGGGSATGGSASGGSGGGQSTDCVLTKYLPGGEADFKKIMAAPWQNPKIQPVFSNAYSNLCKALEFSGFSDFAKGGTEEQNKRELAAFLANVAVETAYLQDSAQNADYTSTAFTVGRGAIQLTYDYNYKAASDYLGAPGIMSDPRVVATDPLLVWETALWFWLHYENTSVSAPNNCHQAIRAGDFGRTLRIIKGDCGSLSDRVTVYQKGITLMGTTVGDTTCEG